MGIDLHAPDTYGPLAKLVIAGSLLALCVIIHAAGLLGITGWLKRRRTAAKTVFVRELWLIVRISWFIIGLHLIEVMIWAGAYLYFHCMPDMSSAFYFSSITYTTVGYGDIVLDRAWRNLSGVEAMTGIFLLGLSTAFFYGFLARMFDRRN